MRNPWGSFEWRGEYNEESKKWTEELKKKVNFLKADDGVFFITLSEFVSQFDQFCICYIHENFKYIYKPVKRGPHKSVYFKLENKKNQRVYIRVHQLMERIAKQEDKDYKYSGVDFLLLQKDPKSGKFLKLIASGGKDRHFGYFSVLANNVGYIEMEPGTYLLKTKVRWQNGKVNEFVVSTYSEIPLELEEIGLQEGKSSLGEFYIHNVRPKFQEIFDDRKYGFDRVGDVYVVCAENNAASGEFICEVSIAGSLNMKIGKKNKASEETIELKVKAKSAEFAIIKTQNKTAASKIKVGVNFKATS